MPSQLLKVRHLDITVSVNKFSSDKWYSTHHYRQEATIFVESDTCFGQ